METKGSLLCTRFLKSDTPPVIIHAIVRHQRDKVESNDSGQILAFFVWKMLSADFISRFVKLELLLQKSTLFVAVFA